MRKAHIIADNKGNEYPNHLIFFDTETKEVKLTDDTTELVLNFGISAYTRTAKSDRARNTEYCTFRTPKVFWDFVERRCYDRQRVYLIAHNITFDFKVTKGFAQLKKRGWTLKKLINVGTRNIWEFRKDKKVLICLDNMNIFNSSLDALGQAIGIPKLKMPEPDAPFKEWVTYCQRDVDVMIKAWEIWQTFLTENNLGNFAKTLASQAFNAYRHRFMPSKIYIHDNAAALELERAAFHGGRTEAFKIGVQPKGDYYYVDVNSMYPAVMQTMKYPTKLIGIEHNIDVKKLKQLLKTKCVIAEVDVDTPENVFPVVSDGRLIFPTGAYKTQLSSREIEYALEKKYITKIHKVAIYEQSTIFHDYVQFFYNTRLAYKREGNEAFSYACKLLLNSLYGKFGQRQDVYEKIREVKSDTHLIWQEYDIDEKRTRTFRLLNGILEERKGLQEGFNSFPAIAAHITADARMKLWGYMQHVGMEDVLYCDTDSIFTTQRGYDKILPILEDKTLGCLSLKRSDKILHIRGAKDYTFGSDRVIKGVRGNATDLGGGAFRQTRFEGLLGAWHKGRLDRQIISQQTKQLTREYKKGTVSDNGDVVPFELVLE